MYQNQRNNVTKSEIENARQMDLLAYLQAYEPNELVRVSGQVYSTRTHDSIKISNGKWFRWSRGIGGRSALDYLVAVRGMGFVEAVRHMNNLSVYAAPVQVYTSSPKAKPHLILPMPNGDNNRVIAYLTARGIDSEVIDYCIKRGMLYEDAEHHNCVFVGFDEGGRARYGMYRSSDTRSTFLRDADGSDKRYSFRMLMGEHGSTTVHLFESAIDAMSY